MRFPNDPKDIFAGLNRAQVRYLVVGGIAAIFYGVPRTTFDADIAVELEVDNLERLDRVMKQLGFSPRVPAPITGLANSATRSLWTRRKAMKVFSYIENRKPFRVLDIMVRPLPDFDQLYRKRTAVKYEGITVPLLPLAALIRMKRQAGRAEDLRDVAFLEFIRHQAKGGRRRT